MSYIIPDSPQSPNASGYLAESFLSVTLDPRFSTANTPRPKYSTNPSPRSRRILSNSAPVASNHNSEVDYYQQSRQPEDPATTTTIKPIDARGAAQRCLQKWLRDFHLEEVASSELAQYLHEKLNVALSESEKLGRPNEYETAVCCHLLDVVTKTFGRYSQLVEQLKVEIYSAIYVDKDLLLSTLSNPTQEITAASFFERETYFSKTKELRDIKNDLQNDIDVATRQRDKLAQELLKKKKVLNATAFRWQKTLKSQSFGMWAKVVQMRKNQRVLLMQYFINRDKSR